jgi:hypothetical protein
MNTFVLPSTFLIPDKKLLSGIKNDSKTLKGYDKVLMNFI